MRTKTDINFNQCDKCGKFVGNDNLSACDIEGDFEGLALCDVCYQELAKGKEIE